MQSTEASVCSIIAAFTSGLDVFKRLRQRHKQTKDGNKGRKSGGHKSALHQTDKDAKRRGEELKLSKSLQRGSADVYSVYAQYARHDGQLFATGDSVAHSSLAHTLLKLNSGLVNIISTFLSHGRHEVAVDYRSLTSLSDASRVEAIDALERLHSRLSQSLLRQQPRLKDNVKAKQERGRVEKGVRTKETVTTERSPELPPGIAKVTTNTSQTQLVWARPVKKRKGSSSSTSTMKTGRSPSSSPSQQSSTPSTPLPLCSPPHPSYPFPQVIQPIPAQQTVPASVQATPPTMFQYTVMQQPPAMQQPVTLQQQLALQQPPVSQQPPIMPQPLANTNTPKARRQDKVTPSFYSFATDSTKLGEIPMRKWTVPFDQVEADRLNAIASASGWRPPPPPPTLEQRQQQQKGRSRFLGLFGKGRSAAKQQAVH